MSLFRFLSGFTKQSSTGPASLKTLRPAIVSCLTLLLILGTFYSVWDKVWAQTGNPSVVVTGGGSVSGNVGGPDSYVSFNHSVSGAPVQGAECTLTGGGPPGPWSGPSYSWSAAILSGPGNGINVTMIPATGSPSTSAKVEYKSKINSSGSDNYTVRVTLTLTYTSSCGNKYGSGYKDFYVTVNGSGKVWTTDTALSVSEISTVPASAGQPVVVANGSTLNLNLSASDNDRWTVGATTGTDPDTMTYAWSGGGTFNNSTNSPTWTPPAFASNDTSAYADFTLSCLVNDTPKDKGAGETGTRDDSAVTKTLNVRVVRKFWEVDTAIQGGALTVVGGQDQVVEEGTTISASVANATDTDKWTQGGSPTGTSGTDPDTITYTWSTAFGSLSQTNAQNTVWTAPNLPNGVGSQTYTFKCRIDDSKTIAANEGGSRDDTPVDRTVSVTVIQKVWDIGTEISGGGTFKVNGVDSDNAIEVGQNSTFNVSITPSTDIDHWSYNGTEGTDPDDLTYTWTSSMGGAPITGTSVPFDSGTLPNGIDSLNVTLTCVVNDVPKAITGKDSGTRNDPSKSAIFNITIKRAYKAWSVGQGIQGGALTSEDSAEIVSGSTLAVAVASATDTDDWVADTETGTEADTITYKWTGAGSFANDNLASTTWTAPALPEGNDSKTYTLTCTINDTPKAKGIGETGTRDDAAITRTVSVTVVRKIWDPETEIQGGDLISSAKPDDITLGQTLNVAVATATDTDSWYIDYPTANDESGTESDTIIYRWDGDGKFANPNSASTTWTPPVYESDSNSETYTLTCTIDDTPKSIGNGEGGSRDDESKTVTVTVTVLRKVWDIGTPISGGIAQSVDGGNAVATGDTITLAVSAASDTDHWKVGSGGPGKEGTESDSVSYKWKATGGTVGSGVTSAQFSSNTWKAPSNSGTYIVTCMMEDNAGIAKIDGGTRDDEPVVATFTLNVTRAWEAGTVIGIDGDGNTTGVMQNQNQVVESGGTLACRMTPAQDFDKWTGPRGKEGKASDVVKYTWQAPAGTTFLSSGNQPFAIWQAPTVSHSTTYSITCILDDKPSVPDSANGETGTRDDAPTTRTLTVKVEPSMAASKAYFELYKLNASGGAIPIASGVNLGGPIQVGLILEVSNFGWVKPGQRNIIAKVKDLWNEHKAGDGEAELTFPLINEDNTESLWERGTYLRDVETGAIQYDSNGVPYILWEGTESPLTVNNTGNEVLYRKRIAWDTTQGMLSSAGNKLWSANGKHALYVEKITGLPKTNPTDPDQISLIFQYQEIDFEYHTPQLIYTYSNGPKARTVDVQNLVITNVSTNNGTKDYFVYDGRTGAPANLNTPVVNLSIVDQGDFESTVGNTTTPHAYRVRVRVRGTNNDDDAKSVLFEKVVTTLGATSVSIDPAVLNAKIPETAGAPAERGSYNFQIQVLEYKTMQDAQDDIAASATAGEIVTTKSIDKAFNRSEHVYIPYEVPTGFDGAGHLGHYGSIIRAPDSENLIWYLSHFLRDKGLVTPETTPRTDELKVDLDFLNDSLEQIVTSTHALQLNTYYNHVLRQTYPVEGNEGLNIAITTAEDDYKYLYRDHNNRSILAKNKRGVVLPAPDIEFDGEAIVSEVTVGGKTEKRYNARASAGGHYTEGTAPTLVDKGRNDAAHTVTTEAIASYIDPTTKLRTVAANHLCRLSFVPDSTQAPEGPRFVVTQPNGSVVYKATLSGADVKLDAEGKISFKVISSRQAVTALTEVNIEVAMTQLTAEELVEVEKDAEKRGKDAGDAAKNAAIQAGKTPAEQQAAYVKAYDEAYAQAIEGERGWRNGNQTLDLSFDRPVSRRLFGIKEWNQVWEARPNNISETSDTGWEFDPPSFITGLNSPPVSPNQPRLVKCRLYLRFCKETDQTVIDTNYFVVPAGPNRPIQPIPSLDRNGDGSVTDQEWPELDTDSNGVISEQEWQGVIRDNKQPLLMSLGKTKIVNGQSVPDEKQIWWPVSGHNLRVRIMDTAIPVDTNTVPQGPQNPQIASFSDDQGNWLGIDGNGNLIVLPNRPLTWPLYLPVTTDEQGIAEFWIRPEFLAHRATQIRLAVTDMTTR